MVDREMVFGDGWQRLVVSVNWSREWVRACLEVDAALRREEGWLGGGEMVGRG